MKIRFTRPYRVLDGTGTRYETGHILTCTAASAAHFISRNVAEEVKHVPRKKTGAKKEDPAPQPPEPPATGETGAGE